LIYDFIKNILYFIFYKIKDIIDYTAIGSINDSSTKVVGRLNKNILKKIELMEPLDSGDYEEIICHVMVLQADMRASKRVESYFVNKLNSSPGPYIDKNVIFSQSDLMLESSTLFESLEEKMPLSDEEYKFLHEYITLSESLCCMYKKYIQHLKKTYLASMGC
jgi:hypothetical protein